MTEYEPKPDNRNEPPQFPAMLVIGVIAAAIVVAVLWPDEASPRNRLVASSAVTVNVLPPPEKAPCNSQAMEILDGAGTVVYAAVGTVDPNTLTIDAVPLNASVSPIVFCNSFE